MTLSIFAGFFLADAAVITGIFEKEKVASVSKRWAKFQDVLFYFQLSFPEVCKEAKKKKGERMEREREKTPETQLRVHDFKWNVDGGFSRLKEAKKKNEITQET